MPSRSEIRQELIQFGPNSKTANCRRGPDRLNEALQADDGNLPLTGTISDQPVDEVDQPAEPLKQQAVGTFHRYELRVGELAPAHLCCHK